MGVVYLAREAEPERHVALKIMRPGFEGLLRREARAMARACDLRSDHVVQVFVADTWGGRAYLAMEYIEGQDLGAWLRQGQTRQAVLQVMREVAAGLADIHAAGLVHCDVKPANVLIGSDGRVKLTDFALAADLQGKLTDLSGTAGTLAYQAPEQHAGRRPDGRADIYAFCVMLYEALYDRPPFTGSEPEQRAAKLKGPPPPPDDEVDTGLYQKVLAIGLQARPEDRFPSMAMLPPILAEHVESVAEAMPAGVATEQIVDKYRLLRKISEGGMGILYEAEHLITHDRQVLKLIHPDKAKDPDFCALFLNECSVLQGVDHPGVVKPIYAGYLPDGSPFLVMPYVAGQTLQERQDERADGPHSDPHDGGLAAWRMRRRMPLVEACVIGRKIAGVLADGVHRHDTVHLDLKPSNIMIQSDPEAAGGCKVSLIDFGIAKSRRTNRWPGGKTGVLKGNFLGTAEYASPEHCNQGPITARSDVYSLGIILYELICGTVPFVGISELVLGCHIGTVPKPLDEAAPGTPAEVCQLVKEMLAKSPEDRPSATQVRDRLRSLSASLAPPGEELSAPYPVADAIRAAQQAQRPVGEIRPRSAAGWWAAGGTLVVLLVLLIARLILASGTESGPYSDMFPPADMSAPADMPTPLDQRSLPPNPPPPPPPPPPKPKPCPQVCSLEPDRRECRNCRFPNP